MESSLFTDKAKDIVFDALQCFFKGHPQFPWSDTDKESKVMIVDKYTINLKSVATENLPAIIVSRGPMRWRNQVINQRGDGFAPGASSPARYVDLIDTTFRIECLSRQGLEAEILASYVFGLFTFFKETLRSVRAVHDIRSAELGMERVGKSDSDIQISAVPVTVSMTLNQTWSSVESNATPLNSICVNSTLFSKALECAKQWRRYQQTLTT